MSCDEISADWAAQRIKGLDLWSAMSNALRNSLLPQAAARPSNGEVDQDADRDLPLSAQGPRHDVGRGGRARCSERGGDIHMGTRLESLRWDERARRCGPSAPSRPRRRAQDRSSARHVISSAPIRELVGSIRPAPACKTRGRQAALPRLPHRRADRREAGPVPRQLDLHPRAEREGRPHPELQVLVAGDGAGPDAGLPRPRVLLLRGRRAVERRPTRDLIALAKKELAQIGLRRRERRQGRLRGAPEEGLSGLRRRATRTTSRRSAASWPSSFPTLHLVGRNGMHKYNNQDHAMMTAMLTVKNIMAGRDRLRRLERQRGRRVPRGRRGRCRAGARQRAPGAAPRRRGAS